MFQTHVIEIEEHLRIATTNSYDLIWDAGNIVIQLPHQDYRLKETWDRIRAVPNGMIVGQKNITREEGIPAQIITEAKNKITRLAIELENKIKGIISSDIDGKSSEIVTHSIDDENSKQIPTKKKKKGITKFQWRVLKVTGGILLLASIAAIVAAIGIAAGIATALAMAALPLIAVIAAGAILIGALVDSESRDEAILKAIYGGLIFLVVAPLSIVLLPAVAPLLVAAFIAGSIAATYVLFKAIKCAYTKTCGKNTGGDVPDEENLILCADPLTNHTGDDRNFGHTSIPNEHVNYESLGGDNSDLGNSTPKMAQQMKNHNQDLFLTTDLDVENDDDHQQPEKETNTSKFYGSNFASTAGNQQQFAESDSDYWYGSDSEGLLHVTLGGHNSTNASKDLTI